MDEELQEILKSLRLWGLLAQWDELYRRGRVRGSRTGASRVVLHVDAKAAQDQDHLADLESGLQRLGLLPVCPTMLQ